MSLKSANEFLNKISHDSELAAKVKSAVQGASPADVPTTLSAIAGEAGFEVTPGDLTEELKTPLSDEDLNQIAGGSGDPYAAWLSASATQASGAASQASAAASAFEAALSATVPPAAITANRGTLAGLIAGNFLGQNTPAIGATESFYAEMWAQDVSAMGKP